MATRNDDRISSARLLDMLKGLQESRHLGSEPEVETETTEYPAVVSPAPGTYQTSADYANSLSTPDENRLPFNVYINNTYTTHYPITINENSGSTVQLTKKELIQDDVACYVEDSFVDYQTYVGYALMEEIPNLWACFHCTNGVIDAVDNQVVKYVWEMPAYTETTTTKTKRTIKQDYVPNADWNQNDPDGDGYVEGRTHWVEQSWTGVIPSAGTYNSFEEFQNALNSVEPSVVYVCDEYDFSNFPVTMPEYTSEPVAVLDKEFDIEGLRVLGPSDWDGNMANLPEYLFFFKQEPYYQANAVMSVTTTKYYRWKAVAEVAHKLDRKFYDYTPPTDTEPFVKHRETFTLYSDSSFAAIINEAEKDRLCEKYHFDTVQSGTVYRNNYFAIIYIQPYYALVGMDSMSAASAGYYISPILLVPKIALRMSSRKAALYPLCDCHNTLFYFNNSNAFVRSTPAQLNKGIIPITSLNGSDTIVGRDEEYENSLLYDIYGVAIPNKYRGLFDENDISFAGIPWVFEYGILEANAKKRYGATEQNDYVNITKINNTYLYNYVPYIKFEKNTVNYVFDCKIVCRINNVSTNNSDLNLIEAYLGSTIDGWSVVLPDGRKGVFQSRSVVLEDNTTITTLPKNTTISSNTPFELPD